MKLRDLIKKKNALATEARALLAEGKVDEAKAKTNEINELNATIQAIVDLEESVEAGNIDGYEEKTVEAKAKTPETKTKATASALKATIKALQGKKLNEVEAALVTPGTNGEDYLLPEDVSTKINKLVRDYSSMRDVLDYRKTDKMSGSVQWENFETVSKLVDFNDDNQISEMTGIGFRTSPFALKQMGALIRLGNTLVEKADEDLINYVSDVFARAAVITENEMAFDILKQGKTKKSIADIPALTKLWNTGLDEMAKKIDPVIVTNQDGFHFLDSAEDLNGRPLLQPWPTDATVKSFKGVPIKVFSNSLLPTVGESPSAKVPIFIGSLVSAATFVDDGKYEFSLSSHAGFEKNVTVTRVIEHVDCVQKDPSDKVYVYGELTV